MNTKAFWTIVGNISFAVLITTQAHASYQVPGTDSLSHPSRVIEDSIKFPQQEHRYLVGIIRQPRKKTRRIPSAIGQSSSDFDGAEKGLINAFRQDHVLMSGIIKEPQKRIRRKPSAVRDKSIVFEKAGTEPVDIRQQDNLRLSGIIRRPIKKSTKGTRTT